MSDKSDYYDSILGDDKLEPPEVGVVHVNEPRDPHMWARRQASKDLGIPEEDLPDEPDEMGDHSDDQGWDVEDEDERN